MKRITVAAGEHSHDVLVGDLLDAADSIRSLAQGRRLPVVTDETIWSLHGDKLSDIVDLSPICLPAGERAKSWSILEGLIADFANQGVTRRTPVLALGGGSVGDVAGLAAALFKRGCPIVHIPTSLVAQVDSAIGGKTAIDALGQRNLVGAFHAPALVVADPAFLTTLDTRQLRSGYAEVVKYGLIGDPTFYHWCEQQGGTVIAEDGSPRRDAIFYCLEAKSRYVSEDFRDLGGSRALLNFGHSFGHAIEAISGPDGVLHGEAVAVGMALAFGFSAELGMCDPSERDRVVQHLDSVRLPTTLTQVGVGGSAERLLALIASDKKSNAGELSLILTRGVGRAELIRSVEPERLRRFLETAS